MKKKLLVLLITAASTMMPNLASAIAIDADDAACGLMIVVCFSGSWCEP